MQNARTFHLSKKYIVLIDHQKSFWYLLSLKSCTASALLFAQPSYTVFKPTFFVGTVRNEPPHDKTNKMACSPSEDSDQPGHPPSLIRVFTVRMKKVWVLSYPLSAQRRLWSDWADAKADLSLQWAHSHFVGFVMRWLKSGRQSMCSNCLLQKLSVTSHLEDYKNL